MLTVGLRFILVCGIPGSGKSTFCEWLEREKGFVHLDFDQLLEGRGTKEKLSLIDLLCSSPDAFLSEIRSRGQSVVIDWGFPIASLDAVRMLKEKGFVPWWFDGDRGAAQEAFTARRTVSLQAFKIQMAAIERAWPQITQIIESNLVNTVMSGPKHKPPECTFEQIFGASS